MSVLFSFAGTIDSRTLWYKGILRWLVLYLLLMSLLIPEGYGCRYEGTSWLGASLGALGLGPLFVLFALVLPSVTVWSLLAICAKWLRGVGNSAWLCPIIALPSFIVLFFIGLTVIVVLSDGICITLG